MKEEEKTKTNLFEERLSMRTKTNNKNHIAEKLVSGEYNVYVCVCVMAT